RFDKPRKASGHSRYRYRKIGRSAAIDADGYIVLRYFCEIGDAPQNPFLNSIVRQIVGRGVGADVLRKGEHCGVLARTIVVKLCRLFICGEHLMSLGLVKRQMGTASKIRFTKSSFRKHSRCNFSVDFFARMRGAGQCDLVFGKPKCIGGAAGNKWDPLKGFCRRADGRSPRSARLLSILGYRSMSGL